MAQAMRMLTSLGKYHVAAAPIEAARRVPDGAFAAAALDLAMLERCDDLVVTRGSSFSFAAHSGRLVSPVVVSDGTAQSCRRLRHSQANVQHEPDLMPDHPWHPELFERSAAGCAARGRVGGVAAAYRE